MRKNHILMVIIIPAVLLMCSCTGSKETSTDPTAVTEPPNETTPVIVIDDTAEKVKPLDPIDETDPDDDTSVPDEEKSFYAEEISDELFARMEGKSFPDNCTTSRSDLRYLHLLYKDIEGNTYEGEMVCNAAIADTLIDIFRQLYEADYPIEKMKLIDDYDGDDDASMADNNTSCFNYRVVEGTTNLSKHARGAAVDLNPLYNPYIKQKDGKTVVDPEAGEPYADRSKDFDYKIDEDDLAYKLFTDAGFTWGGSWKTVKDYQHFQIDIP